MSTTNEVLTLDKVKQLIRPQPSGFIKLPSLGVFYDKTVVKDGQVELLPMSAREEKLIAGLRGDNVDEIIDTLLKRCLVTQLDPDDMLLTDRFFLLLALRANSYGEEYNFDLTCASCTNTSKYKVKILSEFDTKYSNELDVEPFEVYLPVTKLKVKFRLLRGKDAKKVKSFVANQSKKGLIDSDGGDPGYVYRLAKHLVTVNDMRVDDILTAMEVISNLPAKDSTIFKNAIDRVTPGMMTNIEKDCVACGFKIRTDLPMTAEFFRPGFGGQVEFNANAS